MKHSWKIFFGLFALLLLNACVTQKKKEDVGWFSRGYHNITSKYNYWFNADELLRLTSARMAREYKDNYNQLLPVYPETAGDPQSAKSDLDNVITKASKGIAWHRPSDWVDDCYTLIGQAQFLKRDLETAEVTFQYIREELNPNKTKVKLKKKKKASSKKKTASKSKKKKSSPKKKSSKKKKKSSSKKKKSSAKSKKAEPKTEKASTASDPKPAPAPVKITPTGTNPYKKGLKRSAAYPLAMIWYGRTLTERDKYEEADFLYRDLAEDPFFPGSLRDDLYAAQAHLFIKQQKYERAIDPLKKAIEATPGRKRRARLAFILAQLYDRAGQYENAFAMYNRVLDNKPAYEMSFNARLRQLSAGWANGKISSAEATKSLERMTKDDKNTDYLDQVYFLMAQIALKENEKPEAIAYLRKSLDYSKGNVAQRAESFLGIADLYFELEDFVKAKIYYDSTLTVLQASDLRHKRVTLYAANLKDIARLIQTIAANDSIVRIFNMSEAEKVAFAKKLKKQRDAEAESAAKSKASAAQAGGAKAPPPQAGKSASNFYFYNDAFLKKGKRDFNRAWGTRKLEDNWRRSQRPQSAGTGDEATGVDSTKTQEAAEADVSEILKGIPRNEAELAVIHISTYEAMYQLGRLFREKLENNRRCAGTLEETQSRYPDTLKYEKEIWYFCFLAYTDLNDPAKAKYYYDKLVGKYPNSAFARTLSDPGFMSASEERRRALNKYYEETYAKFQSGAYKEVLTRCDEVPKQFGSQNILMPKFALLSALSIGNVQGNEAYCKSLSEVIARYPESAEATRAREIARLMGCKGFEVDDNNKKNEDKKSALDKSFVREDDKQHYFMVSLSGDVKLDDVKGAVSDYNREFHRTEQLRVSNMYLGTDTNTPILVIRKFDSKEQAMRYFNEVKGKPDFLGENKKKTYQKEFFVITQENYRKVLRNKTLEGYREFFEANYTK